MGTIVAEIYEDKVPITARNFIDLAYQGYYDGTIFHRVISEFMIQGGDPTGTGMGGHAAEYHEGYGDPNDPETWVIPDEFHPDLHHDFGGFLSMANSGADTGGSQFFITVNRTSWLDGKHAIFGRVMMGIDVIDAISEVETDSSDRPIKDVVINSITIVNDF
jgi:peptidyl-prolyl cis-trans isomerase A (cyclophilin A)